MKKRLVALISLIISVFMTLSCLAGCNLVTLDSERDMNKVIATVSIDDGIKTEIKKKEVIIAYLNYGYTYTQYYGYSQAQTFNVIIEGLINDEILLQNAMKEMEEGKAPFDTQGLINQDYAKWDVKRYLTQDEITESIYEARKVVNDMLDTYDELKVDKVKSDALTEAVRAVPTNAANKEEKLSVASKAEYNDKAFDVNSSKERRQAFNTFITLLKNNGLLGEDYDGTIESTDYYKNAVQSFLEASITGNYEEAYNHLERSKLTFDMLKTAYQEKYEEQKVWSNTEFANALSSSTATSPVLYSAYGKYGYVYNLLLGVNAEQEKAIGEIDTTLTKAEKVQARKTILDGITARDLRSTWITSGYDFDGAKFTGDYTFAKDSANALPFKGAVKDLTPEDTTDNKYSVKSLTQFTLTEFVAEIENYVYGETKTTEASANTSVYKKVTATQSLPEYDARIQDLLFAFSTDPGSLNTYKGYAIKPAVDGAGQEEYVTEFADAGRELLGMGGKSYIVVGTDYGYHFMFFSQVFDTNYGYATLVDYLNSLLGEVKTEDYWKDQFNAMLNDWNEYEDKDSYLFLLSSEMTTSRVTSAQNLRQNNIINDYTYERPSVKKYTKTYSELVAE